MLSGLDAMDNIAYNPDNIAANPDNIAANPDKIAYNPDNIASYPVIGIRHYRRSSFSPESQRSPLPLTSHRLSKNSQVQQIKNCWCTRLLKSSSE